MQAAPVPGGLCLLSRPPGQHPLHLVLCLCQPALSGDLLTVADTRVQAWIPDGMPNGRPLDAGTRQARGEGRHSSHHAEYCQRLDLLLPQSLLDQHVGFCPLSLSGQPASLMPVAPAGHRDCLHLPGYTPKVL